MLSFSNVGAIKRVVYNMPNCALAWVSQEISVFYCMALSFQQDYKPDDEQLANRVECHVEVTREEIYDISCFLDNII